MDAVEEMLLYLISITVHPDHNKGLIPSTEGRIAIVTRVFRTLFDPLFPPILLLYVAGTLPGPRSVSRRPLPDRSFGHAPRCCRDTWPSEQNPSELGMGAVCLGRVRVGQAIGESNQD